jgi:hypothetical protein
MSWLSGLDRLQPQQKAPGEDLLAFLLKWMELRGMRISRSSPTFRKKPEPPATSSAFSTAAMT